MGSSLLRGVIVFGLVGLIGCSEGETREAPDTDPVAEEQTPESTYEYESPNDGESYEDSYRTTVAAGTEISVRLTEEVSTATHSAGDPFSASVDQAVTDWNGNVLIPAGTSVQGMVSEARQSEGADEQAILVLTIESLTMNGQIWPIEASMKSAELNTDAKDSTSETVGKVAVGAAAGAIVGQILGKDTESTLKGAGVGAVAGAIVAFTTRDGHATAPAGSVLVIELEEPIAM